MGSLLGNYVHLNWSNYLEKGIDRFGKGVAPTEDIFDKHKQHIQKLARQKKVANLRQIQDEYNRRNTNQYNEFLRVMKNAKPTEQKVILKRLVEVLVPKDGWGGFTRQEIFNNLKWDETRQTIYYEKPNASTIGSSTVNFSTIGGGQKNRQANALLKRCNELKSSIQNNKSLSNTTKNDYINQIQKHIVGPIQETYLRQGKTVKGKVYNKLIPASLADGYYNILNNIKKEINGVEGLNTALQTKFSEIIGNLVGDGAIKVGSYTLFKNLKKSLGSSYSKKDFGDFFSGITFDLDKSVLGNEKLFLSGQVQLPDGTYRASYSFKGIGDPKQQKADTEFTISLDGQSSKTYGLSLKNTDFLADLNSQVKEDWGNFIDIQEGSPLLLYLAGMNNYGPGISNHYLNIFTEHEDLEGSNNSTENIFKKQNVIDKGLRESAFDSFKVAVLYSALTGRQQTRKGGEADILAIYDKGTIAKGVPRVRLFDMSSIIDAAVGQGADQIARFDMPKEERGFLKNTKENSADSKRENQNIRITKVLLEAKRRHISVYISKYYLNQVAQQRGF